MNATSDPAAFDDWDHRVATHAQATAFHSRGWSKALVGAYGYTPLYVTAPSAPQSIAVLPLMEVVSWLTGKRGVSLPFTDDCPPIASDEAAVERLYHKARQVGLRRGWNSVEFRHSIPGCMTTPSSVAFYSHQVRMSDIPDEMALPSGTRGSIRKAEKSGVRVTFSDNESGLKEFHSLLCFTRKRHGAPPQPFGFFSALAKHVFAAGHGFVATARLEKIAIASAVFLNFRQHGIYKFAASDDRYKSLSGPSLVLWRSLQRLTQAGVSIVNLGRTSLDNTGLRKFKRGWNADEGILNYYRFDFRQESFVRTSDQTQGWKPRLLRRLPMPCLRILGALTYRHLA